MNFITLAKPMCKMAVTAFVFYFSAALSANATCIDPAGPGVDWSGCDLYDTLLDDANLTGADLTYATLFNADLRGAYLSAANLNDATLTDAILMRTILEHATACNTTAPDGSLINRDC